MRTLRQIRTRFPMLVLAFLTMASSARAGFSGNALPPSNDKGPHIASTEVILVKLKEPRGNPTRMTTALRASGLRVEREIRSVPGLKVLRSRGNATAASANQQGLENRMKALRATGLFEYVEPDWSVQIQQTAPTDTSFTNGDLWGLQNTGQNGGVAGIDVNAVAAWALTTGSPTVIVGVVDTGVRYTHQDISGNMWTNPGEIPGNGSDDDGNGYIDDIFGINAITGSGDPMDDNNHGTHVAGTIAATAFDSGGHVGVAYSVKLMALKFLDNAGSGSVSGAISCIDYAITHGATILNNSWGGSGFSQALKDSIEAAHSAGILFVAAAGNDGTNNDSTAFYPAGYDVPNIISVAAIDRSGALASFSNYGASSVDLAAPGVAILSSTSTSDSSYAYFNGTSMAAPHVAGVAALVANQHATASIFEQTSRLLQSTTPLYSLSGVTVTGGMVNAEAALLIAEDGDMEFQANTINGALVADKVNTITLLVTDLIPVTGATVSAFLTGGSPAPFLDDGTAPDSLADDAIYTASLFVPGGSSTIDLSVSATAPGKNPSADVISFNIITPPPNDDFDDRFLLSDLESTTSGTNVDATLELEEPVNPLVAGRHSAWWEWVPTVSGNVTVSTTGSSYDTTLAIYQGTALNNLTLIGSNDDRVGVTSAVTFTATASQSYLIQVNGYDREMGTIQLNYGEFTVGVPNDDFANRIVLQAGTNQAEGTNVGATIEPLETLYPITADLYTVWWEWIAPSTSPATIDTLGSGYDTTMAVYEGTNLGNLVLVAENDDISFPSIVQSSVTFTPIAGQSYMIQISGYFDDPTGSIVLNYPDPGSLGPPNDFFANRIILDAGSTQATGTNTGSTLEVNEPTNPVTAGDASSWWEWISPVTDNVAIDTLGSSFDTTLAVYTGDQLLELVLTGANDDASDQYSSVSFLATQGQSYMIQVNGSEGATGDIKLNYPEAATPPPTNDDFDNRIILALASTQRTGTNEGATIEAGEPMNPAGSGLHSIWWEWIGASSSPATIDTIGSDFDTTLAVYTGEDLTSLSLIADNNDDSGQQSSVTFTPVSGSRYFVQVNGHGTTTGSVTLNYPAPGIPRPPNDNFANRIVLSPGTIRTTGSNDGATIETSETKNPSSASGQSVWWEWIAPSSSIVRIDTADSFIDTTLAIYTGSELGALSLVGSDDNYLGITSAVTFSAVAGESYMIQVDVAVGSTGQIYLNYPMPFPVAVTPGSMRLAGVVGGSVSGGLSIANGDAIDVEFSISSPASWISVIPASGTLPPDSQIDITLDFSPLPTFFGAEYATIIVSLNHPQLSSVEVPIEIIDESFVIDIPDANLRTALEEHLGRLPGEPLANIELAILTTFDAPNRGIVSLEGLEYAVNLFDLFLSGNQVSDISPLGNLTALAFLDLSNNNLSEISVLQSLPILLDVDLRLNYLDTFIGSDDRAVIDALLSGLATVEYDPQKPGMMTLLDWTSLYGFSGNNRGPDDINSPLGIPNILAFMMGLNPFTATAADLPVAYRIPGTNTYTFTYYRDLKALGILTTHQKTLDLSSWDTVTPVRINVLWEDGNGLQMVEAVFEEASDRMFFMLEAISY